MEKTILYQQSNKADWNSILWDRIKNEGHMTTHFVHLLPDNDEDSMTLYLNDFANSFPDTHFDELLDDQEIPVDIHNVDEIVTQVCDSNFPWVALPKEARVEGARKRDFEKMWPYPMEGAKYTNVMPAGLIHAMDNHAVIENNTMIVTYFPCRNSKRPIPSIEETKDAFVIENHQIDMDGRGKIYWYDYCKWRIMYFELDGGIDLPCGNVTMPVDSYIFGIRGEFQLWFHPELPLCEQEKVMLHGMSGVRIGAGLSFSGEKYGPMRGVIAQHYEDDMEREDPVFIRDFLGV